MGANSWEEKIRIVVAIPGIDGHRRGVELISKALRDAGMEVIYLGPYQLPEWIADAAIAEDADAIALSTLAGTHKPHFEALMKRLRERNCQDICVFGGGIIPTEDRAFLENLGVTGFYGPGTPLQTIVNHVRERVLRERKKIRSNGARLGQGDF